MSMFKKIQELYCIYVVKTLLHCPDDDDLNMILDKVAEKNKFDTFIQGDDDIKQIFEFVYLKRLYYHKKINFIPYLDNKIIIKVALKSIL